MLNRKSNMKNHKEGRSRLNDKMGMKDTEDDSLLEESNA